MKSKARYVQYVLYVLVAFLIIEMVHPLLNTGPIKKKLQIMSVANCLTVLVDLLNVELVELVLIE